MSFWTAPIVPEIRAVMPPQTAIMYKIRGAYSKIDEQRITKNTPAVTIVAAWIKADTGVGPSIASGSQVCKPIWADLPTAPKNKKIEINSIVSVGQNGTKVLITAKSSEWKTIKIKLIPVSKNRSPILLIINALVAALPAWARVCQKPISKYEHKPTPSHPINSTKKIQNETNNKIKNVNSEK